MKNVRPREAPGMTERDKVVRQALVSVTRGGTLTLIGFLSFRLFNFLRQLITIRLLTPADYGLIALGMTFVYLYTILMSLGLTHGIPRLIAYYYAKDDLPATRGVIISTLKILTLSTLAVTVVSLFLAGPLASMLDKPELQSTLLWFAVMTPFLLGLEVISSFYIGFARPGFNAFFQRIGLSALSALTVLLFLIWHRSLTSALVAQVLSSILVFLAGLAYTSARFPIRLKGARERARGREVLSFSLPLLVAVALSFFMFNIDTLMLGYYVPSDLVGLYSAAFSLAFFASIFLQSVQYVLVPVASGLVAKKCDAELKLVYQSGTKWIFIFTLPIFMILFCYPSNILNLLFAGDYSRAAAALQLLCLGDFINAILGPNTSIMIAYGHSKALMICTAVASLTVVVLNVLLIPSMGITGAAVGFLVSLTLFNLLCSAFIFQRYRVHPFSGSYARVVLILGAASALLYYPLLRLLEVSNWLLVACYILYTVVCIGIVTVSRNLEPVDKMLIRAMAGRVLGKIREKG